MTILPHPQPARRRPAGAPLRRVNRSWPALRAIVALVLREMSTRYGRSPGGYIWAILEPLGGILILSIGFSLMLRTPSLGTSFLLFYASGFMPFQLYNSIANAVARSVKFSRSLLFYPAVTWIDALIARFVLNALTGLLVTYILLTGILVAIDARTVLNMVPMLWAMALTMGLGLGVGTLNCALFGLIPSWESIWSIVTRPLFIVSGVIFLYEDLPQSVQDILWWNPLMHVTGLMRKGVYSSYQADYVSVPFVTGVSLVCLLLGLVLMGRYHRALLND